jgi:hypothetical protein
MELILSLLILVAYLAAAIYVVIHVFRWAKQRNLGWKGSGTAVLAVVLVAYAIPFGDHTAGYLYFRHLCDKEAGDKVYRTVTNVRGFWWWPIQSAEMALKYGYSYVEGGVDPHSVSRYEIHGGKVTEQKAIGLGSRYIVRETENRKLFLGVVRGGVPVVDLHTGEKLAERIGFHFRGGWVLRKAFSGSDEQAGSCGSEMDSQAFINSVLQPAKRG